MTFLSERERETLRIVCDALIPAVEPQPGDDPELFRLRASDLDVHTHIEATLEQVASKDDQRQFKLLLRGLENGFVCGLIAGHWRPISKMPQAAREKLLFNLANSRFEQARTAFLSIKRLATFLFYSVMPEEKPNPTWKSYDYHLPMPPQPPEKRPIEPLHIDASTTLETDVLVIGSGAGGGVVAGELAAAGHDVIVVEKGGYHLESDYDGSEAKAMEQMYEKAGAMVTEDTTLAILAGSTLGGGTTINWAASFRTPDHVLQDWERVIGFSGATGPDLQHSFDAVSKRVNINTDESDANANNAMLERGAAKLGYNVDVVARNVKGCEDCGFCNFGCQFGAKQSTLKTYLQDAYDAGARIVVNAHVDRVLHRNGKVGGVVVTVTNASGHRYHFTIHAKIVVVSAGTLHTPALLMRSGLTNPNIGDNLRLHPTTVISGVFEEDIYPWRGAPIARGVFDFKNLDGRGYGVWLENAPAHPGINGMANAWVNARQHKRTLQQMKNTANIIILVRDRDSGRVKVGGDGQPTIDYRLSRYDADHLLYGVKEALKIHVAAGAREVHAPQNNRLTFRPGRETGLDYYLSQVEQRGLRPNDFALFSAHQMSSCRIGGDPGRGAIDPTGQSYEVENLYVADGSALPNAPGVNPMVSIMGVSHYIAQHIKAAL
jgi:choline dehydrogenase-like flavoprotein